MWAQWSCCVITEDGDAVAFALHAFSERGGGVLVEAVRGSGPAAVFAATARALGAALGSPAPPQLPQPGAAAALQGPSVQQPLVASGAASGPARARRALVAALSLDDPTASPPPAAPAAAAFGDHLPALSLLGGGSRAALEEGASMGGALLRSGAHLGPGVRGELRRAMERAAAPGSAMSAAARAAVAATLLSTAGAE